MSPRTDHDPISTVDGSGRSIPASESAIEARIRLDDAERKEPPPWTWLVGAPPWVKPEAVNGDA